MKIKDLTTTSVDAKQPCELVQKLLLSERMAQSFTDFVAQFDFASEKEIEQAVKHICYTVCQDVYMQRKTNQQDDPFAYIIYRRFMKLATDISRFDKFSVAVAGQIWRGGYRRAQIERNFAQLMTTPPAASFGDICDKIMSVYGISAVAVEKIHFFVEQVKAGEEFPNSLRRMLYLWGVAKKTGKTTVANTLVAILNGERNTLHVSDYSTRLQDEMQVRVFAVPRIAMAKCCVMDECFYADMGKTYADFKRFMTESNGRARLPYGQEFAWTGEPNYIATSNDCLKKFIKDWDDRRYLSVEFAQRPQVEMTFAEIYSLWRDFVATSTRSKEWQTWADEIFELSAEQGERMVVAEEIVVELQQRYFADFLAARPRGGTNEKITLKVFVDFFSQSMGSVEAHKRRGEIERAVETVFGKRYSTTNYWRLQDLLNTVDNFRFNDNENELL